MTEAVSNPHASRLDVKREVLRRKRVNRVEHVHEELNIVAMMDMMTIILVFLLKSLSSSAASIPQGADLTLPRSSIDTAPSSALQVIVSRVSITVNGRFVTSLRNGEVDPSLKRGGGNGFVINPLAEVMADQRSISEAQAQRLGRATQEGLEVAIIADHRLPSRTVYEVLYTCGQHHFTKFQLLVLKSRSG